jgi:hypothetical protein
VNGQNPHPVSRLDVNPSPPVHPTGHVLVPAAAIGGLSLVLAAGLELTGVLAGFNEGVTLLVSRGGAETFPKRLPEWLIWLAAIGLCFATASTILATPGILRRVMLWLTTVILVGTWAPVLSLAAHAPEIAAPWIATVWSGVCALVYSSRHRMPCDAAAPPQP